MDWDDKDASDKVVELNQIEELTPENDTTQFAFTMEQINDRTFVKDLPHKGRCLFTKVDTNAGDTIFIEDAVLIATPSKNQKLWDELKEMYQGLSQELGNPLTLYTTNIITYENIYD